MRRRSLVALLVAAVALALVGSPAFAFFTGSGSGAGGGATGTLQPVTVVAATVGSPSSALLPGSNADLLLRLTNPNSYSVVLVSVAQAGGVTVVGGTGCTSDPGWPATLGTSGVSVNTVTGLSVTLPAGTTDVQVAAGSAMSTASVSGCQGATFQVPVTVGVRRP